LNTLRFRKGIVESDKPMCRAFALCPGSSNIDLFGYRDSVINLDAEVSHGALDLGVAEEELNGTQVSCAPIDQRGLGPPQRVGAVKMWI